MALAPLVAGLALGWRILLLGSVAVVVGVAAERVFRRALPLAALLRMTMLFPDRGSVALQAGAQAPGARVLLAERARHASGGRRIRRGGDADPRAGERARAPTTVGTRVATPSASASSPTWSPPSCTSTRTTATGCAGRHCVHDIGKIEAAASILNKPASLDAEEWVAIRRHPERGAALAGPLQDWLGPWGDAIEQHHERFDGAGYPHGLAGHQISLAGRVVAVADVFEVDDGGPGPTRVRCPYGLRGESSPPVAGSQLDPTCVRAFLWGASLPRVLWAVGPVGAAREPAVPRRVGRGGSRAVEQAGSVVTTQAVTTAVAATTAVVVVAAPGAGAVESPPAEPPRPTSSHSVSGQPGGGGAGGTGTLDGSTARSAGGRGTGPDAVGERGGHPDRQLRPPALGTAEWIGGWGASALRSLSVTPEPSPTVSSTPAPSGTSNSGSGNSRDPADPVVVGPLVPVLVQPCVVPRHDAGDRCDVRLPDGWRCPEPRAPAPVT